MSKIVNASILATTRQVRIQLPVPTKLSNIVIYHTVCNDLIIEADIANPGDYEFLNHLQQNVRLQELHPIPNKAERTELV